MYGTCIAIIIIVCCMCAFDCCRRLKQNMCTILRPTSIPICIFCLIFENLQIINKIMNFGCWSWFKWMPAISLGSECMYLYPCTDSYVCVSEAFIHKMQFNSKQRSICIYLDVNATIYSIVLFFSRFDHIEKCTWIFCIFNDFKWCSCAIEHFVYVVSTHLCLIECTCIFLKPTKLDKKR